MTADQIFLNCEVLTMDQKAPLEALKAYTIHAAHCSFEENNKGSIEKGKLADFAVLSGNPLKIEPDKIKDIRVLRTIIGGKTVYEENL